MVKEKIVGPATEIIQRFWTGISKLVIALVVFLIGWIVAKFIMMLITRFFKIIKIDKLAEESGLKGLLEKGNVTKNISELLGIGVYWLVMLVVIFISINIAGISIPPTVINSLLGFIPKFILGLLIFIFSLFLGNFFSGIVRTSAGNAGIEKASLLGKITQGAIITFGVVISLQHIGIATNFIGNVFVIVLSAFCFGLALAFALGAKDIVKEYIEKAIKKEKKQE